ncbi:MAG: hypothetical protein HZA48_06430 [Planctomycetes bacterium]|nr:hypothetical protein [Planctomycetota bacterium]
MKETFLIAVFVLTAGAVGWGQSTSTYTPATANCAGYDRVSTTSNPPVSPYDASWQSMSSSAITAVSAIDASRFETRRTTARYQYDTQLFRFKVTQNPALITQLDPKWIGYGESTAAYPCYLYIWNLTSQVWVLVQQQDIGSPDGTLTGTITTNISDYVSSEGIVYLLAQAKHYNYTPAVTLSSPGTGSTIWDTVNVTMAWTMSDFDGDAMQAYANVRRSDDGWSGNSGWLSAGALSWNTNVSNSYYTYYWKVQVKDNLATSAFTSEWSFYTDVTPPPSTCPLLYVWNGNEYKYVTDLFGGRITATGNDKNRNFPFRRPQYTVINEDFQMKNNVYEFKVREVEDELSYIDELELLVVEHPSDVEIVSASAERPNYSEEDYYLPPEFKLYSVSEKARLPVSVKDENGNELKDDVLTVNDYPLPVDMDKQTTSYIFDFGQVNSSDSMLVIDGWMYILKSFKGALGFAGCVELLNKDGGWEKIKNFGHIGGDFRTLAIPLGDVFNGRKDHRIRITLFGKQAFATLMDRVRLDVSPQVPLTYRRIPATEAVLAFAGNATPQQSLEMSHRMLVKDDSIPVIPDNLFTGNFTRYGDVKKLLKTADDQYVIMSSGDQINLKFNEPASASLEKGRKRTLVLKSSLYYKNKAGTSTTDLPLPYKDMKSYPYSPDEGKYPFTAENLKYIKTYNTRTITGENVFSMRNDFKSNIALKQKYENMMPHSLNTDYTELKVTYSSSGVSPSVPILNSPVNSSADQFTSLVFRWQASSGTSPITYEFQVATDLGFTSLVSDITELSGEFYSLDLSAGTQYYWRVKAANIIGSSNWSTEWSFTTGTAPTAPSLSSPSSGAQNAALAPDFSWTTSIGTQPVTYTIEVDIENTFANPTVISVGGIYDTAFNPGAVLNQNTLYYWRVMATNLIGTSSWSSTYSFTTGTMPSVPALVLPLDLATDISVPAALEWNASTGSPSITYTIQVDDDSLFGSPEYNQGYISTTDFSVSSLDAAGTYYWRVKARNDIGESSWAVARSFSTSSDATVPSTPVLSSPANNTYGVSLSSVLLWQASTGTTPITYRVQVSTDASFALPSEYVSSLTWQELNSLSYETIYYWRVRGENAIGNSSWVSTYMFSTIAENTTSPDSGNGNTGGTITGEVPVAPVLSMPSNGSEDIDINVDFGWFNSNGTSPVEYIFQMSLTYDMANLLYVKGDIASTFTQVEDLSYDTVLYWRVKASNDYGESGWSEVWQLTTKKQGTAQPLPTIPILAGPLDNTTVTAMPVVLSWADSSGTGTITYNLQVSISPVFSNTVMNELDIAGVQKSVSELYIDQRYYWRVRAHNENGYSAWSNIWSIIKQTESKSYDTVETTGTAATDTTVGTDSTSDAKTTTGCFVTGFAGNGRFGLLVMVMLICAAVLLKMKNIVRVPGSEDREPRNRTAMSKGAGLKI